MIEKIKFSLLKVLQSPKSIDNGIFFDIVVWCANIFLKNKLRKVKIVPLATFMKPGTARILKEGEVSRSYGPRSLDNPGTSVPATVPDLDLFEFNDVLVNPFSSCLLVNNKLAVDAINPQERYNEGFVFSHGKKNAVVVSYEVVHIEEGFILFGNGTWNWYHWLIEILPKVLFLDEAPTRTLLVSNAVLKFNSMKESVELFVSKGVNVIYLDEKKNYEIKKAYYVDHVNYTPFNYFDGGKVAIENYFFRDSVLKLYVAAIREKVAMVTLPFNCEKIYLARKGQRLAANEQEVVALVKKYGFRELFLEEYGFVQQIAIFSMSDYIIGTTGAAWSNLIFAKAGSKGLCFMDKAIKDFPAFTTFAKMSGADLMYSFYDGGTEDVKDHSKSGFKVNINEVEYILTKEFSLTSIE